MLPIKEYTTIQLPTAFIKEMNIDALIERGLFASRSEYVKQLIRNDMRERDHTVNLVRGPDGEMQQVIHEPIPKEG